MNTPGQRIRLKRLEKQWSQAHLASLVGISQSTLCELELGESKMPSATVLHSLADKLGVSPTWILTGKEGEIDTLSDQESTLIATLRGLSAEQQRAVYAVVATMTGGDG